MEVKMPSEPSLILPTMTLTISQSRRSPSKPKLATKLATNKLKLATNKLKLATNKLKLATNKLKLATNKLKLATKLATNRPKRSPEPVKKR